jgi:uncharacterized protein (UPF0276 family)
MGMARVGLTLQPDELFLDLLDRVAREDADYYEVTPETLWAESDTGFVPNRFHARLRELVHETGKPVVGHGVGLSLGNVIDSDPRRARHLEQLARDAATFRFAWLTEHLGASVLGGENTTLPLPMPMTGYGAGLVRARLRELQTLVPDVGIENTCHYFLPGDPLDEPHFISRVLDAPRTHLLLDLHNLFTMAQNFGFDPDAYLDALDLERVIELHVSGGAESPPGWLPDGSTLRLDSHDGAVPEPVWRMLEDVVPRCPQLSGVTLERMEGTVDAHTVPLLREELGRIRRVLAA